MSEAELLEALISAGWSKSLRSLTMLLQPAVANVSWRFVHELLTGRRLAGTNLARSRPLVRAAIV